jgi:hypothetical protein
MRGGVNHVGGRAFARQAIALLAGENRPSGLTRSCTDGSLARAQCSCTVARSGPAPAQQILGQVILLLAAGAWGVHGARLSFRYRLKKGQGSSTAPASYRVN